MTEENQNEVKAPEVPAGAFVASLRRNNKQVKDDRAAAVAEDCEMAYKRTIENLIIEMKRLNRSRDNMLDLSPENTFGLVVAKDFNADKFVEQDVQIAVNLRNMEIKLELLQKQYKHLFGLNAPEVR
jgi:hypothetical protein